MLAATTTNNEEIIQENECFRVGLVVGLFWVGWVEGVGGAVSLEQRENG